jgi:hypothetical protein
MPWAHIDGLIPGGAQNAMQGWRQLQYKTTHPESISPNREHSLHSTNTMIILRLLIWLMGATIVASRFSPDYSQYDISPPVYPSRESRDNRTVVRRLC